ncbi:MAG: MFS transporter [Acidimicrobiales bacterium]
MAFPTGPILGGWLLTNYWWGWVFLINLPVVVVGLSAVVVLLPKSRAPERPGLDLVGRDSRLGRRARGGHLRPDRGRPGRME